MSENTEPSRDTNTGQFSSPEPATGRDGIELEQGFRQMPEPKRDEQPTFADEREAAAALSASRVADPIREVKYLDTEGSPVDTNETLSIDRAAADLSKYHANQADSAARSISSDFADAIDSMRKEAIKGDPALKEHFGVDPDADAAKDEAKTERPAKADIVDDVDDGDAIDAVDGLTPKAREYLKDPVIRAAIEQDFAEAAQVREQYSTGLQSGQQLLQAAVAALAPQLQNMPVENWPQAIQMLAAVDPVRAQLVSDTLTTWGTIQQAQQQEQQQRAYAQNQQFEAQRQQYSKQADAALGPMTFAEKAAMAEELVGYVSEFGLSREQLMREAQSNLALSHPAFQRMAADAIKFRRMQNAPKAVATRDLPPVQRPGVSQIHRGSDNSGRISSLEKQLSSATSDKAVRLAAKIQGLKRKA